MPTHAKLTKKTFQSNAEPRWCPGCGDYSILAQVQTLLPELGILPENCVFISGIGCSSRFPYYMNTYGFHTIHGRAPAFATGLKMSRPELSVWVVTGDGDALSIGGNHFIHLMRRNVDVQVLLFNNRIYGLTKGQYSPTSELGKETKSTPAGSIDAPFSPLQLALGAHASFVARSIDVETRHLREVLARAAQHKGTAFIEILQTCNVFNDGAWEYLTHKQQKEATQLRLQNGKPLLFHHGTRGIRLRDCMPEVVTLGENGVTEKDILRHDEKAQLPLAMALAALEAPDAPTALGVLRAVQRPAYHELNAAQLAQAKQTQGPGDLTKLLYTGDTWTVP